MTGQPEAEAMALAELAAVEVGVSVPAGLLARPGGWALPDDPAERRDAIAIAARTHGASVEVCRQVAELDDADLAAFLAELAARGWVLV